MLPKTVLLHEVVDIIIATLNARDPYTFEHSERVAHFSEILATTLELSSDKIQKIHIAAHLHDIGKIAVSDSILKKEGSLTDFEYAQMKEHPQFGENIIQKIPSFCDLAEIIVAHHERVDGKGYPLGLRENEIPEGALILAVADSFDAIVSNRPYRDALTIEFAIDEINRGSGTQFSPLVVDAFNNSIHDFISYVNESKETKVVNGGKCLSF